MASKACKQNQQRTVVQETHLDANSSCNEKHAKITDKETNHDLGSLSTESLLVIVALMTAVILILMVIMLVGLWMWKFIQTFILAMQRLLLQVEK